MSRGPKGEKRTQIDDLRTAYHVVNFVQQVGWFRRECGPVGVRQTQLAPRTYFRRRPTGVCVIWV
jgi:hypothetical protein